MKKQKVLSLILAAALCVGTPASAMAAEFSSGSENDAVQVTTEAATEDTFTDSTDDTTEETTENAEITEFAPEVEDGEEGATLNAEAGNDIDHATSISLNTKYTGALSDNNDVDFYKVTLNEAGVFNIKCIFRSVQVRWRIYDDFGTELDWESSTRDDISQRGTFDYSWNLTRGTYYISIDPYSNGGRTGTYSFSLGFKSANETIPEDQRGSNNSVDDADEISLNKVYKAQLALNDSADWYKFMLPKAGTVKFIVRTPHHDVIWSVYEEVDGIINKIDDQGSGSATLERDLNLNAGNYYLAITRYNADTTYQFKVQPHIHSWKNEITKATLTENGTIIPRCACGETGTIKTIYCPKTIRLSKTKYKYNGYAQKPTVKVIGSDGKVISPSYYKVTYSRGLTAKGKYTVKITFKGRYSGSVKKYFKIV